MALMRIQKELIDLDKDPLPTVRLDQLMKKTCIIGKLQSWDLMTHLSLAESSS